MSARLTHRRRSRLRHGERADRRGIAWPGSDDGDAVDHSAVERGRQRNFLVGGRALEVAVDGDGVVVRFVVDVAIEQVGAEVTIARLANCMLFVDVVIIAERGVSKR